MSCTVLHLHGAYIVVVFYAYVASGMFRCVVAVFQCHSWKTCPLGACQPYTGVLKVCCVDVVWTLVRVYVPAVMNVTNCVASTHACTHTHT